MHGWLNFGSLVLGLAAWILPIVNLVKRNKNHKNWTLYSILSISACAMSLFFQIAYHNYLVRIGDWAALMDTSGAVVWLSFILTLVTILLNAITVIIYNKRSQSKFDRQLNF